MNAMDQAKAMHSQGGEPPLPFEHWSSLSAKLMGRRDEERDALLRAAQVDPSVWMRADAFWSLTLAEEHAAGDRSRSEAFGAACAAELERRGTEPPAELEDTLNGAEAEPAASAPVAPPSLAPWASPAVTVEPMAPAVPTFLKAVPAGRATVALAPFAAPRPAMPFTGGDSPLAEASVAPTTPARAAGETVDLGQLAPLPQPPRSSTGTVALDVDVVARILEQATNGTR